MMNSFLIYSLISECIDSIFNRAEIALNSPSYRIVSGARFSSIVEVIRDDNRDYRYTYHEILVLDVREDGFLVQYDERVREMRLLGGTDHDREISMGGTDMINFGTVERIKL